MPDAVLLSKFQQIINRYPELRGARIGLYDQSQCILIDPGKPNSPNYRYQIIIEAIEGDTGLHAFASNRTVILPHPEQNLPQSAFKQEMVGAGIACVGAAAGFIAGSAALVPTGGVSAVVVVSSWISLAQCGHGAFRAYKEYTQPGWVEEAEKNKAYKYGSLAVDTVGVGLATKGVYSSYKAVSKGKDVLAQLPAAENLKGMSNSAKRQSVSSAVKNIERQGLKQDLKAMSGYNSNKGLKKMKEGTMSVINRDYDKMYGVANETLRSLASSFKKEALVYSLQTAANFMPDSYVGSASGILNYTSSGKAADDLKELMNISSNPKNYNVHILSL